MDTNEALAIPSFGKERHIWHIPEDAPRFAAAPFAWQWRI